MAYDNLLRPGVRTSTSIDPRRVKEDIDEKIRRLDPEACPLLLLTDRIGRGPKPKNHKITVMQYDTFDHFDICTDCVPGTAGNSEERYARLSLSQRSRPTTKGSMLYYPQDKLYCAATNQTLEIVATPTATKQVNGSPMSFSTTLTGNTANNTSGNNVIVRNIEPQAVLDFTRSDVVFMGRTIHESQPIEAQPAQRDVFYDVNFCEHKEAVLVFTQPQREWLETKGSMPDWTFQQRETLLEFKKSIEYSLFFGERAENYEEAGRPTRHMRGLIPSIQTHVSTYNPDAVTDFEQLFSNFLLEQGFRYNPNGKRKMGFAGAKFLQKFSMQFRDYRNIQFNKGEYSPGLNVDSYNILGMELLLMRNEVFRLGTEMDHWCVIFDPQEAELRTVKNFESRPYSLPNERDYKWMVEWCGTVAWHREEVGALLRTN